MTAPARQPLAPGSMPASLPIDEILYEAEGPVVFLTRDGQGRPLLAYVADKTPEGAWTLLAAVSRSTVAKLKSGALPVRDALAGSWLWLHRRFGERSETWIIESNELPEEYLPLPGTPLLPEHVLAYAARA